MSEEKKLKKYFIKDQELSSIKEDKLNSKDIAKNISMIIENVEPSYAIAVTGKSGIGKSSVINILKEKYAENSEEYNIQKINVWKQDKTLKEILDENYSDIEKHEENYQKYSTIVNKNSEPSIGKIVNINSIKNNEIEENIEKGIEKDNENNIEQNDNKINIKENEKSEREKLLDKYYNQNSEENDNNTENSSDVQDYYEPEVKTVKKSLAKIGKFILTVLISFIITTLIFIFMEYMGNRGIYNRNDVFFVENTYLNYKENFLMILVFTIGLIAIAYIIGTIIANGKKSSKKTKYNDYQKTNTKKGKVKYDRNKQNNDNNKTGFMRAKEMIASEKIKNIEKQNKEELEKAEQIRIIDISRKNIIIIEDVDKLTATKMLKTLEDVKHCKDYKNCILIIPFDEKVLVKAIEFRNQVKLNANYRPLRFEKIFDKVFQFKVFVPNISNGNIKDFAVNLAKDYIPDFIEDYTDTKTFEKVLRNILIYKNVKTPRHVKKLINNFVNNKILIMNRVKSGKIDETIVNEPKFDYELAKISVIQSDFPEFYDLLFEDFDYLQILTSLCCMDINELRNVYEKINEDLKPFFANKYIPLRNFLIQTKNYEVKNMSILMYLTKVKIDKMFKNKSVYSYIIGEEDITELRIQEVLELVKTLDSKQDIKEFTENNFAKLLEKYEENPANIVYFTGLKDVIESIDEYISEQDYTRFLELVAENYNYYPRQALEILKNSKCEIPVNVMNTILVNVQQSLSKENFDDVFEFIKDNSDPLYEDGGNISEYVHFLVNYISLSSNPNSVIKELDDNFTRIGKIYELNKNIKGLDNLDYDKTYEFFAKCIENSDFDKMIEIINSILSDENSVQDCLKIEEKMSNYSVIDVIECNVDDIIASEKAENDKKENKQTDEQIDEKSGEQSEEKTDEDEDNEIEIENGKELENNFVLLKNMIEICAVKQKQIQPVDTLKILEKATKNISNYEYLVSVIELLNKFETTYFYEIRRDFNDVLYSCFHNSRSKNVKKAVIDITKYFNNMRLFKTKLTQSEEKFVNEN